MVWLVQSMVVWKFSISHMVDGGMASHAFLREKKKTVS